MWHVIQLAVRLPCLKILQLSGCQVVQAVVVVVVVVVLRRHPLRQAAAAGQAAIQVVSGLRFPYLLFPVKRMPLQSVLAVQQGLMVRRVVQAQWVEAGALQCSVRPRSQVVQAEQEVLVRQGHLRAVVHFQEAAVRVQTEQTDGLVKQWVALAAREPAVHSVLVVVVVVVVKTQVQRGPVVIQASDLAQVAAAQVQDMAAPAL